MLKAVDFKFKAIYLKTFLLLLLPYLGAFLFEHLVTESMEQKYVADSVFNLRSIYQSLITAGPREIRPNYTVIIDINPKTDMNYTNLFPEVGSPCGEKGTRNALAQLLTKINEQRPAEIVIDKFFNVSCEDEDIGTKNLLAALQNISKETPIIIGRLAPYDNQDNVENNRWPPVLERSQPLLTFKNTGLKATDKRKPHIVEGIVNIDPDNRKTALEWWVRRDEKSQAENIPTLSFAAVKIFFETQSPSPTSKNPAIDKLLELDHNPYVSFIERPKFDSLLISAGQLISDDASINPSRLRGKIAIIGESANQYDQHNLFDKNIPGVMLQANYIEAMLDQRYYKPTPWLDYAIGFLVFFLIYYYAQNIQVWWKLLIYIVAILIITFLLLFLPVVLWGIYINPISISGLGIAIIFVHLFFPKHQAHQKVSGQDDHEVTK